MAHAPTTPTERLVLRAVLNDVSPIVARVIVVPDDLEIHELHEVFLSLLGLTQDLGYIVRIRAQEFNSFRRKTRGTRPRERLFDGSEEDWAAQPTPDGPMTMGIDGGFVRARRKAGFFEVIAGKSIVAFTREEAEAHPSAKRFAFVQTYDTKPRRRVWELMKSQGLQENQEVLFLSDGGETVRKLQAYLHPSSEHYLDWFHVTLRLTVMTQQNKALIEEDASLGTDVQDTLESVKHYLCHGNVEAALERLESLSFDLDLTRRRSAAVAKLCRSVSEFDTYIRNNRAFIPNFGERYRHGDTISTALVESTINLIVSKRFSLLCV